MSNLTFTKTRFFEGVWEGVLTTADGSNKRPAVTVTYFEKTLDDFELLEDAAAGHWLFRAPIPANLLADGTQTFVLSDANTGEKLDSFSIVAGKAVSDDIRVELDLLRQEFDMLKRAFRRHCVETA